MYEIDELPSWAILMFCLRVQAVLTEEASTFLIGKAWVSLDRGLAKLSGLEESGFVHPQIFV